MSWRRSAQSASSRARSRSCAWSSWRRSRSTWSCARCGATRRRPSCGARPARAPCAARRCGAAPRHRPPLSLRGATGAAACGRQPCAPPRAALRRGARSPETIVHPTLQPVGARGRRQVPGGAAEPGRVLPRRAAAQDVPERAGARGAAPAAVRGAPGGGRHRDRLRQGARQGAGGAAERRADPLGLGQPSRAGPPGAPAARAGCTG